MAIVVARNNPDPPPEIKCECSNLGVVDVGSQRKTRTTESEHSCSISGVTGGCRGGGGG